MRCVNVKSSSIFSCFSRYTSAMFCPSCMRLLHEKAEYTLNFTVSHMIQSDWYFWRLRVCETVFRWRDSWRSFVSARPWVTWHETVDIHVLGDLQELFLFRNRLVGTRWIVRVCLVQCYSVMCVCSSWKRICSHAGVHMKRGEGGFLRLRWALPLTPCHRCNSVEGMSSQPSYIARTRTSLHYKD